MSRKSVKIAKTAKRIISTFLFLNKMFIRFVTVLPVYIQSYPSKKLFINSLSGLLQNGSMECRDHSAGRQTAN
ncbi:hypothetical protein [Pseudobacillus sp. 179-B 2D1 NHS]|uniref:hypothetical protein n=1 Tax=Pseudobacillus sp. 179-B 2D1 NHS TaxID=3374292 RepID=UPI0038795CB0